MQTLTTLAPLREALDAFRHTGDRIAFVPTMGHLHRGHLRLIEVAKTHAERVVVSIFVNPLQFGVNEDFAAYPRSLDADAAQLEQLSVDILFAPSPSTVYPQDMAQQTRVQVPLLSERLCGASRPGHFTGVATVVSKFFNLVQPNIAVFGEKDFQQLLIIQHLIADLGFPITLVSVPTQREADGLALSSRNRYLTAEQRQIAPLLQKTLQDLRTLLQNGAQNYPQLVQNASAQLTQAGFHVDYLEICRPSDLNPATSADRDLIILVAAYLGQTRLIDNLTFIKSPSRV